jgi:hypothetical protein
LCPSGLPRFSLAHHVSPPWGSGTSQTLRANKHHMAVRPEEQAKAPLGRGHGGRPEPLGPGRFCARSRRLCFVAPHVWLFDSQERRESNSLGERRLSTTPISASILRRAWPARRIQPRLENFKEPISARQLDILTAQPEGGAHTYSGSIYVAAPIKRDIEELRKTSWI